MDEIPTHSAMEPRRLPTTDATPLKTNARSCARTPEKRKTTTKSAPSPTKNPRPNYDPTQTASTTSSAERTNTQFRSSPSTSASKQKPPRSKQRHPIRRLDFPTQSESNPSTSTQYSEITNERNTASPFDHHAEGYYSDELDTDVIVAAGHIADDFPLIPANIEEDDDTDSDLDTTRSEADLTLDPHDNIGRKHCTWPKCCTLFST